MLPFHFLFFFHPALTPSEDSSTVYRVEQENCEDAEQESTLPSMPQSLLLFLFLQHSDPFISHISDLMGERQQQLI